MEYEDRVNRVLCRIVKRLGMEPLSTDNYSNFKELYRKYQPRLILLSLDSPSNNQGELCRYLVDQKSPSTIILLSNMDEDKLQGFEKNGRAAGLKMGGILRKPVDLTSVQEKLEELIRPDQGNSVKKKVTCARLKIVDRLRTLITAVNTARPKTEIFERDLMLTETHKSKRIAA